MVDPRFDAQFQRGYDPVEHGAPKRRDRVEERRERVEERREATRLETRPESADAVTAVPTADPTEPDDLPPRNPFSLALLIGSVVCLVAAAALFWQRVTEELYYGGVPNDPWERFFTGFVDASLEPLLTGGLLGIVLWLVLGALRRRP